MIETFITLKREISVYDQIKWCNKNIGQRSPSRDMVSDKYPWHLYYSFGDAVFCFTRSRDAMLFALRWL